MIIYFFKPHVAIFGPQEIKHDMHDKMSNNHQDVLFQKNAINEMGVHISKVEYIENVEAESIKKAEQNTGLQFVKFIATTTTDALKQNQSNGMSGREIVNQSYDMAAATFSEALSKEDGGNREENIKSFNESIDKTIEIVGISNKDLNSRSKEADTSKNEFNQYDNLDR